MDSESTVRDACAAMGTPEHRHTGTPKYRNTTEIDGVRSSKRALPEKRDQATHRSHDAENAVLQEAREHVDAGPAEACLLRDRGDANTGGGAAV